MRRKDTVVADERAPRWRYQRGKPREELHRRHHPMVFEDALRVPGEQERLKVDPYAWAPFGGGIRRCLGMAFALHEMKVILATMFGMGLRLELENRKPHETILRSVIYSPKGETRVLRQEWGRSGAAERGACDGGWRRSSG